MFRSIISLVMYICSCKILINVYNVRVNDSGNNISLGTIKLLFYLRLKLQNWLSSWTPSWISQRCERGFKKGLGFHKLKILCFPQTRFQRWTSILNKMQLALWLIWIGIENILSESPSLTLVFMFLLRIRI